MEQFLWVPGNGIDLDSLDRLRSHFKRPAKPMGEAWFMGDQRHLFHELMGDIGAISPSELHRPLEEIASGTSCFGPYEEWSHWYHFLLGELLPRAHEEHIETTLELLITGFMTIHPNGVQPLYKNFHDDVLKTLGRCMMEASCWTGTDIEIGRMLHRSNNNPNRIWRWWDACGDFSASMFFCLKYLPEPMMEEWLRSALAIPSPHWRAQILVWMVGAHEILIGKIKWPSKFPTNAYPSVSWASSYYLKPELATADDSGVAAVGALLPEGSRTKALQMLRSHFTENLFIEWLLSISTVQYLQDELAGIPSTFEKLYVNSSKT